MATRTMTPMGQWTGPCEGAMPDGGVAPCRAGSAAEADRPHFLLGFALL